MKKNFTISHFFNQQSQIKTLFFTAFLSVASLSHAQVKNQSQRPKDQPLTLFSGNQQAQNQNPLDAVKGKREEMSRRDANTKHFDNGNGTYTALISNGPMHYLKNGAYQDINSTITINNGQNAGVYPFGNTTNLMESYFGATASKGILSKSAEGQIKEFTNNKMYWQVNGQQVAVTAGADVPVQVSGEKAVYANIFQGIDAAFEVMSGTRKLNYVLRNNTTVTNAPAGAEYLVFSEDVSINSGWSFTTTAKGVQLKDNKNKIVYSYQNPVSHDANEMGIFTPNTIMEVVQNGNTLTILTKVKTSWLLSADRIFPIMVDPTATYYPNNAADASGQCYPTGGGSGIIAAGYQGGWYRGWATFNTTGLPACTISSATVSLNPGNIIGTFSTANALFVGQSKYDLSSLDFFPGYDDLYEAITDIPTNTDGAYAQITSGTLNTYMTIDLGATGRADIAKKAGGANSFFPISLSSSWGSSTTARAMVFYGYDDTARRPYLTVTYTQTEPHCHPTNSFANCAAYGDCAYIGISNVTLGSLNNTTTYNNTPTGYNFYATPTMTLTKGDSYEVSITYKDEGNPVNPGNVAAWIDWNQDGSASADEFIGTSGTMTNNQIKTFSFTVPMTALSGTVRLRVRSAFFTDVVLAASNYCTSLEYGETEDYNLTIAAPPENDDCFNATTLTVGTSFEQLAILGTTTNATDSNVITPNCGNFIGSEVWYKAIVPANGQINFETRSASGSNLTDTGMAVVNGACDAVTGSVCDDDSGVDNFSLISLTGQTPGSTVYVIVWGKGNTNFGDFEVSAWSPTLGVHDVKAGALGIFPNPAQSTVSVKGNEPVKTIEIYSLLGQLVKIQQGQETISVSDLPSAVYMLQATFESGFTATEKFIKN